MGGFFFFYSFYLSTPPPKGGGLIRVFCSSVGKKSEGCWTSESSAAVKKGGQRVVSAQEARHLDEVLFEIVGFEVVQ
ncbi:hypothetical protein CGRA01v4_06266 [Colletotrichum graminicola]|nr:hypothetical protein CGRA01v4_06266 [Colletotrichum graminicola]